MIKGHLVKVSPKMREKMILYDLGAYDPMSDLIESRSINEPRPIPKPH